jgi:hypothetical protein
MWSDEDRARIVAKLVASGDSVSAVARRHGIQRRQLFGGGGVASARGRASHTQDLQFVPALLDVTPAYSSVCDGFSNFDRLCGQAMLANIASVKETRIDESLVRGLRRLTD